MDKIGSKTVVVIVAHPDDETLWTGGTILSHPAWNWFVVSVCRRSDADRAPKFFKALKILKADGIMGDLDDGPEQKPLDEKVVEQTVLGLLPSKYFDLIITHNPSGEYTRHMRHEEVSAAVIKLWHTGKISARELWLFAYEDGNKQYYPKADENASMYRTLTKRIWARKYTIIKDIYGFSPNSWEAEAAPRHEAFWQFSKSFDAKKWLINGGTRE